MIHLDLKNINTSDELVEYALSEYETQLINYVKTIVYDLDQSRDIVQDSFIKLYKQDVNKVKGSVKSWLFTVSRNRALDVLRKEKRMVQTEDETLEMLGSSENTPVSEIITHERTSALLKHLSKLPKNQRTCIELKFRQAMSYKEIEKETGLKSGNIGFLINAGLKKLRESLPKFENF